MKSKVANKQTKQLATSRDQTSSTSHDLFYATLRKIYDAK